MFSTAVRSFLFGLPVGITFFDSVGYVARVDGISMQPALNPDPKVEDYVFLSKWSTKERKVKRGEIVSLVSPKDPNESLIKRVIAVEGDYISTLGYKKKYIEIPEGHCWVEGDHTGNTLDSNSFGPVCVGLVTAKASYIVWPPNRWQRIKRLLPRRAKVQIR